MSNELHPGVKELGAFLVRVLTNQAGSMPVKTLEGVAVHIAKLRKEGVAEQELQRLPECISFHDEQPRKFGQVVAGWLLEHSKSM